MCVVVAEYETAVMFVAKRGGPPWETEGESEGEEERSESVRFGKYIYIRLIYVKFCSPKSFPFIT